MQVVISNKTHGGWGGGWMTGSSLIFNRKQPLLIPFPQTIFTTAFEDQYKFSYWKMNIFGQNNAKFLRHNSVFSQLNILSFKVLISINNIYKSQNSNYLNIYTTEREVSIAMIIWFIPSFQIHTLYFNTNIISISSSDERERDKREERREKRETRERERDEREQINHLQWRYCVEERKSYKSHTYRKNCSRKPITLKHNSCWLYTASIPCKGDYTIFPAEISEWLHWLWRAWTEWPPLDCHVSPSAVPETITLAPNLKDKVQQFLGTKMTDKNVRIHTHSTT